MANETEIVETKVKTSIQASDWIATRDSLIAKAKEIVQVTNEQEFEAAGAIQSQGTKLVNKLERIRKDVTAPLDEIKKDIMAQEKALRKDIEAEVVRIKQLTTAYATEQARKAEEERRRIEEAERKAAEAQLAAEEAAAADPFGFNAPAAPVAQPLIPQAHSSSNRVVEKWDFTILDEGAIPRQFLSVDETKIRAFLNAKKAEGYKVDQIQVAGLKFSSTMQVYSR